MFVTSTSFNCSTHARIAFSSLTIGSHLASSSAIRASFAIPFTVSLSTDICQSDVLRGRPLASNRAVCWQAKGSLVGSADMSLGISTIDHVQMTVPRALEAECLAFYRSVLGLKEIPKPEE